MTELLFPLAALVGVFGLTVRSLGLGFVGVFAVGYVGGVIRANYLGVYTTFLFDAGLLGLYLGVLVGRPRDAAAAWRSPVGRWAAVLIVWPALLTLVPVNDPLIQLVALRATVWFLPVLVIATRLRADDLGVIARGVAVLNLVALAGGLYVYRNGVESLYPENAVTQIIYKSNDVAGHRFHRVPSFFLSSHAYGGAMLLSLPFLLGHLFSPGVRAAGRVLAVAGVAAAVAGILLCAARQPGVQFVLIAVIAWVAARFHPGVGVAALVLAAAGVAVALAEERLQRVTTAIDAEALSERVRGSANEDFLELLIEYPAGAGMGSSVGTSIPFFLAERAPKAVGLENEYSRIQVDQGLVGLGLWVGFLFWLLHRPPPVRFDVPWGVAVVLMFATAVVTWGTAFIGTGALSAVPGSVLLLTQMGVLARVREVARP